MSPVIWRAAAFPVLLLALLAAPAAAQEASRGDVFAGVSAVRDLGTEDVPSVDYGRGWVVAAGVRLPWWRLTAVGDLSQHSRSNIVEETQQLLAVLGGVRGDLVRASRLTVFVQALAGLERFTEPGFEESGPAFQPGAGVDVRLWSRLGARAQTDFRLSRQAGATYREVRVSVGVVAGW